jgi:hypothetical protein
LSVGGPFAAGRMRSRFVRSALAALVLLAAGCSERTISAPGIEPVEPEPPRPPDGAMVLVCTATVATAEVECAAPPPETSGAGAAPRIIGGQDVYVRLSNSGTVYTPGSGLFTTNVTVQNLTRHSLGTVDGVTVGGVRVFFASGPTVSEGSGNASISADGTDAFTASGQPYLLYEEVLAPLQISQSRVWAFSLDATVVSFTFTVYVAAPMIDETAALLGSVWTGAASSDWSAAGNWVNGDVPDTLSAVTIPLQSMLAPGASQPTLSADAEVGSLRVGTGSSLALDGNWATVRGNVDAVGAVSGGGLTMSGPSSLLGGTLSSLRVTGSARVQRPTVATGAVSVSDGSLTIRNVPLTISLP